MELYPDTINMDTLFNKETENNIIKEKIYSKILNKAHRRIKIKSRQKHGIKYIFFVVPEFVIGTPTYNQTSCIAYIIDKLELNGFYIKYTHPNLLYISWTHYINSEKRRMFKTHHGYSIDGFGNEVTPTNTNTHTILAKPSKNIRVFKDPHTYEPTGNLIYNKSLLTQITNTK
jgi:hypothetical protein